MYWLKYRFLAIVYFGTKREFSKNLIPSARPKIRDFRRKARIANLQFARRAPIEWALPWAFCTIDFWWDAPLSLCNTCRKTWSSWRSNELSHHLSVQSQARPLLSIHLRRFRMTCSCTCYTHIAISPRVLVQESQNVPQNCNWCSFTTTFSWFSTHLLHPAGDIKTQIYMRWGYPSNLLAPLLRFFISISNRCLLKRNIVRQRFYTSRAAMLEQMIREKGYLKRAHMPIF